MSTGSCPWWSCLVSMPWRAPGWILSREQSGTKTGLPASPWALKQNIHEKKRFQMWFLDNQIKTYWISFLHLSCHKTSLYIFSLWKPATTLNCCTMKPICVSISSRMTHCYWTWADGSIPSLSTWCHIHLLWGFSMQFVMQMFHAELQGLFSWLNSRDAAGNLYVMFFWSLITAQAAKTLGLMRGLFLFNNLSTKSSCLFKI